MSSTTILNTVPQSRTRVNRHGVLLFLGYALGVILIAALAWYGWDYYVTSPALRPFSPKHTLLKPSGVVGLKLGILGLAMFVCIFLYPLRKRWTWLQRFGDTKHWMDFHVMIGIIAPIVIAFHCSFKFRGFAGMAFGATAAVALSGIAGRYLYAQIPRRVTAAELSLREAGDLQERYTKELAAQQIVPRADLQALLRIPNEGKVAQIPILVALVDMVILDLLRPWRIARLRRHTLTFAASVFSFGGLLRVGHPDLESVIEIARRQAVLSKRVVFLSRAQRLFHLWHVIHRPFSYSFAVFALIHIAVVFTLGYF